MKLSELIKISKQMGSDLLQAAMDSRKKQFSEQIIQQTRSLLEEKTSTEESIKTLKEKLEQCEKRIHAIGEGEFNISNHGEIKYTNEDLNLKGRTVLRCNNCGSPSHASCV